MTALGTSLELLLGALRAYLAHLRSVWGDAHGDGPVVADVDRLVAGVGSYPKVAEGDRLAAVETVATMTAASGRDEPLGRLAAVLGVSPGEQVLVAAAWWTESDPQLATLFGCAHDDGNRRYPSASLLRLLLAPFGIDVPAAVEDRDVLVRGGLLEPGAGPTGPLRLTPTAREVLAGGRPEPLAPRRPVPDRLVPWVESLSRHLASGAGGVVALRGPAGGGRRSVAVAAVAAAGRVPVAADRPVPELRLLARLGTAVPVAMVGDHQLPAGWTREDGPLVAIVDRDGAPPPGAFVVALPPPSHADRTRHWAASLAAAGLPSAAEVAPVLAARFSFTEGDIDTSVARAQTECRWDGAALDERRVWRAARRHPEHALGKLAQLVSPAFTLDDVVVPPECRRQLDDLISHVTIQHLVLDEWGFRRRLPRGQGVAALFTGLPGTGKTMAVEAVAAALQQDLYRIDLAAVVSKYIGETEKNLAAAFDEAERAGAVLFFDEADSLFGKRTEVRDAHDRYANLEVNYLLQRVESFTGLVVLATNRRAAIDEAFLRRLRFVIRFDPPGLELRRRLWRQSFPSEAAVDDLDWDRLARPELAGGNIQSVALHAAYRAAAAGQRVGAQHVEAALRREFDKLGRAWPELERQ